MCIEEITKESIEITGKSENQLIRDIKNDHAFSGSYVHAVSGMPKVRLVDVSKLCSVPRDEIIGRMGKLLDKLQCSK